MDYFGEKMTECEHDWQPHESQFDNEYSYEVECTKCGMFGEKSMKTDELIHFPVT